MPDSAHGTQDRHTHVIATPFVAVLLIALLTALVFGRVLGDGFVAWDDNIHVYENPFLNPVSAASLRALWVHPYEQLYVPLSYMVYAALAAVSHRSPSAASASDAGLLFNPHPFHLANLLIHCVNAVLVFVILRRLVRHEAAAAGGALLFALHPVQVESVAWISEMRGTLCGFFSLLALWQYLVYVANTDERGRRASLLSLVLASAAFVCALLCKPAAVALPLMAGILAWYATEQKIAGRVWPLFGWAALAAADVFITRSVQSVSPEIMTPIWARPLIAGDALGFYLRKLFVPISLGPDYGRTPSFVLHHGWECVLMTTIAVGLAIGVWRFRRQAPWLAASAGLFVAWLLPVLGLIPFTFQWYSTVADRYLYLALLGPSLALTYGLSRARNRAAWGFGVAVLVVCACLSVGQVRYWNSSEALFRHTLRVNPRSWTALDRLGEEQDQRGRLPEAIAYYKEALAIQPDFPYVQNNLGKTLVNMGKLPDGVAHLAIAVRLLPDFVEGRYNLGRALLLQGNTTDALAQFAACLRLQPEYLPAWNNTGVALERQGKLAQAIACYRHALQINPDYRDAQFDLGDALSETGDTEGAIACYRRVLALQGDDADSLFNLGEMLCEQRRMAEALPELTAFVRLRPNDAPGHYFLGVAEATLGDTKSGEAELHTALRLKPNFSDARRSLALIEAHAHR